MLEKAISIGMEVFAAYPQNYIGGLTLNITLTGLVFLVFWKLLAKRLARWKIQIDRALTQKQIRRELLNAALSLAVSGILSSVLIYLATKGHTKIYLDIKDHSVWFAVLGFPLLLLLNDAWFYWIHRLLHHPKVYRFIHAEHHRSIVVNPFTSFSFHALEPVLLTIWVVPVAFLVPIYMPVLALVQVYGLYENIKSHLGYELFPKRFHHSILGFLTTSTYHTLHHTRYQGNYGLHFTFWDRLMGTQLPQYQATFDEVVRRRDGIAIQAKAVEKLL
jgi:Delta7-sterol 5-desaturase